LLILDVILSEINFLTNNFLDQTFLQNMKSKWKGKEEEEEELMYTKNKYIVKKENFDEEKKKFESNYEKYLKEYIKNIPKNIESKNIYTGMGGNLYIYIDLYYNNINENEKKEEYLKEIEKQVEYYEEEYKELPEEIEKIIMKKHFSDNFSFLLGDFGIFALLIVSYKILNQFEKRYSLYYNNLMKSEKYLKIIKKFYQDEYKNIQYHELLYGKISFLYLILFLNNTLQEEIEKKNFTKIINEISINILNDGTSKINKTNTAPLYFYFYNQDYYGAGIKYI
jgi:hypothetical protein